ncbi:unnamed protein product [Sphagnum jensenii]|uniref:Kinesin-like protein n=1 Tax=Sphagnum jensenii TaxID=128206 RepID=A0ABP1BRR4_9BRYO
MGGKGFESSIEIFLRMRPINSGAIAPYEVDVDAGTVVWTIPRQASLGMMNHQVSITIFHSLGSFKWRVSKMRCFIKLLIRCYIWDVVKTFGNLWVCIGYCGISLRGAIASIAEQVVVGALDGYNGTIFAYGQTGSGKTYTITGGAERYLDRGIIPRAISLVFSEVAERSEYTYTIHFSYLEVYNEMGYDLLNPDHETKALEDLPKVTLLEDEDSVFHLRNLSQHLATNEEEALNLLFIGDTNRIISSTPMNMASSRSHCIFTAHIVARKAGEDTIRRSKLNLVDLAGSERVWKSGVDGQILREAKYINLSLHFLEQVIVALQERSHGLPRNHIPYRNSMMTSVLRDSLGGNCRTVMIATVTIAQDQLEETISTCRFAQRVAMVSNEVILNEEVDPNLVIKRLKQEIHELKEELMLLRGENEERPPLTTDECEIIDRQVVAFINDTNPNASLQCGASMMHIRTAFQIFKKLINHNETTKIKGTKGSCVSKLNCLDVSIDPTSHTGLQAQVNELQHQLAQRDNEIDNLVAFIKKQEAKFGCQIGTSFEHSIGIGTGGNSFLLGSSSLANHGGYLSWFIYYLPTRFLKKYDKMEAIQENKVLLKTMYMKAKALGEHVNRAHENIDKLKGKIEKHRVERARNYLVSTINGDVLEHDFEEDHLLSLIDAEKRDYKQRFSQLRDLKKEIEHLHKLLEQGRVKLQACATSHIIAQENIKIRY